MEGLGSPPPPGHGAPRRAPVLIPFTTSTVRNGEPTAWLPSTAWAHGALRRASVLILFATFAAWVGEPIAWLPSTIWTRGALRCRALVLTLITPPVTPHTASTTWSGEPAACVSSASIHHLDIGGFTVEPSSSHSSPLPQPGLRSPQPQLLSTFRSPRRALVSNPKQ